MPEQPPDPLHYDMRVPPPPDPSKQREAGKPSSNVDESESGADSDNMAVPVDDREQKGKGLK
jgi:hypothetical protein